MTEIIALDFIRAQKSLRAIVPVWLTVRTAIVPYLNDRIFHFCNSLRPTRAGFSALSIASRRSLKMISVPFTIRLNGSSPCELCKLAEFADRHGVKFRDRLQIFDHFLAVIAIRREFL